MSPSKTTILSGSLALLAGTSAFTVSLVVVLAGLSRLGFQGPSSELPALLIAIVAAGFAAFEAFRRTFNALCERWSEEVVPPHIDRIRYRRNVVRTGP